MRCSLSAQNGKEDPMLKVIGLTISEGWSRSTDRFRISATLAVLGVAAAAVATAASPYF